MIGMGCRWWVGMSIIVGNVRDWRGSDAVRREAEGGRNEHE